MSFDKRKTILIALAVGFFIVWILELRRTSLIESYWLLLAVLTSLLSYQYLRIRQAARASAPTGSQGAKGVKPSKKKGRK